MFWFFDMVVFQKVSFHRKLDVWVTYSRRYFIKVVRMDHKDNLDHLGFRQTWDLMCKFQSKSNFLRNTHFSRLLRKWIIFWECFSHITLPLDHYPNPLLIEKKIKLLRKQSWAYPDQSLARQLIVTALAQPRVDRSRLPLKAVYHISPKEWCLFEHR